MANDAKDEPGDAHVIGISHSGWTETKPDAAFKRMCEFLDLDPEWAKANMWSPFDALKDKR